MFRNVVRLFALPLVIFVGGCAEMGDLQKALDTQKPRASIENVSLTRLTFEDVDLAFDVKVENPNPVAITLAALDYDLKVAGNSFVNGNQQKGLAVAAGGASSVSLPVTLNFEQLLRMFATLRTADQADYELALGLSFDVPLLGRLRLPLNESGTVPIPKLPAVSLNTVALNKLSLSGADLILKIDVDNPNAFALALDKLNYAFEVNGQKWASGVSRNALSVDSKGKGTLSLPVSLDFLQLGSGLYSALQNGKGLDYKLTGDMAAATDNPFLRNFTMPIERTGTFNLSR